MRKPSSNPLRGRGRGIKVAPLKTKLAVTKVPKEMTVTTQKKIRSAD